MEVDDDGDVVVVVGLKLWMFNPEALVLESAENDRVSEGEQSTLSDSGLKQGIVPLALLIRT